MSTNKTQNYNLHSWTGDDDFRFHEINENFTLLDAALKAEVTELNETMTDELTEVKTALGGKVEMVYGIYAGDGTDNRHFDLGRKPLAVHIEHRSGLRGSVIETYGNLFVQGGNYINTHFTFEETGFLLPNYQYLNNRLDVYSYIAFFA